MRQAILSLCVLAAASAAAPSLCSAQLVGDDIVATRIYFGVPAWGPVNVTVAAGPSDTFPMSGGNNIYVDVEASAINILFGPEPGFGHNAGASHYMLFEDFDYVGDPSAYISGISVSTNNGTLSAADASFGPDWVRVNVGDAFFHSSEYFNVTLTWAPTPGAASLALIAGAGAARRRRR